MHPASVEAGDRFFARVAPSTRAIADPELQLYRAFGLKKGTLLQLFGPRVVLAGLQTLLRGHLPGKPAGNPLVMPGAFLVEGRAIRWESRARHAGDHPDADAVSAAFDTFASKAATCAVR